GELAPENAYRHDLYLLRVGLFYQLSQQWCDIAAVFAVDPLAARAQVKITLVAGMAVPGLFAERARHAELSAFQIQNCQITQGRLQQRINHRLLWVDDAGACIN